MDGLKALDSQLGLVHLMLMVFWTAGVYMSPHSFSCSYLLYFSFYVVALPEF